MARRSTGNISAVKRGTEQARPQHGSNPTVRGAGASRGRALWAWRLSHSPLSVLTSFSRTRTRYRTRTGGPSRVIRCGFVAFSVGAICGGFHKSQSEHVVGQLGCMAWIMVGSAPIQFNGSPGAPPPIASSPSLVVLMLVLDLPAFPSADYRICPAHMQCSSAAVSSEVAIDGGGRDLLILPLCREAEVWVLSVCLVSLHLGARG